MRTPGHHDSQPTGKYYYVRYDRMLLVQWLFQTLITPYLKQIRKDRVVPVVSPTGWSIMRGRHVARPTRTLLRAAQGQQQVGG